MARSYSYLVPLDFSRGSVQALDHALMPAREHKGRGGAACRTRRVDLPANGR
jgi:hypothetical protein